jgi:hypothetical protein
MPLMNQKNAGVGSAALDLGLGDALKVQVDDQVADQKAKQKKQKPLSEQFGNVAQDLMGPMGMGLGV